LVVYLSGNALGPVSALMGNRLRTGKLSWYAIIHSDPSVGRRNEYQLKLGR